jgi:large subunit ribosomal protein L6
MSRIGKKVIILPEKVTLDYNLKDNTVTVKGPLGTLSRSLHSCISLTIEGNEIHVKVKDENEKFQRAIWGTSRAIIFNMINGVSVGYTKEMELNGVGYKMELATSHITLYIGFSHTVKVDIPKEIKLTLGKTPKTNFLLKGESIDKEIIGRFFNNIHNMKPCDPYKHKGFKFPDRFYRKKASKKGK